MAWIEPDPKKHPNFKGPWYVRYRSQGLKRRSEPIRHLPDARTEEAARTHQEHEERKHRHGNTTPGTNLKHLWNSYIVEVVAEGTLRKTTAAMKSRILEPYLSRCHSLRDLTGTWGQKDWGNLIGQWKTEMLTAPSPRAAKRAVRENDESLAKPYSPTTVSITLRALQTFLEWCKTKKYLPANPMEDFPMPRSRERRDLVLGGKPEIDALIENATHPLFRLFLTFSFYQGMRRGMIHQIEGEELHLNDGVWFIPQHKTKMGYDVTVPLHARTIAELRRVFPNKIPRGPIFMHSLTIGNIQWCWHQTKVKAGITYPLTLHGARRTWATGFMKHTQNLKALMQAGAWKDTKTAMKYQHFQTEWLKQQFDKFDY